jgi:hypothetical protein
MRYYVEPWKNGWGIWRGWRWFRWRVVGVGPFGFDEPWLFKDIAESKVRSLSNPPLDRQEEAR